MDTQKEEERKRQKEPVVRVEGQGSHKGSKTKSGEEQRKSWTFGPPKWGRNWG